MQITAIKEMKVPPYITKKELQEKLGIGRSAMNNRVRDFREQIKDGRYGELAHIQDGDVVLIDYFAWLDFMNNRDKLNDRHMAKYVEPYDCKKIAQAVEIR